MREEERESGRCSGADAPGFEPVAPDANAERGDEGKQCDSTGSGDGHDEA